MRRDGSDVRQLTNFEPSHFARVVRDKGVDSALSRLAYSKRSLPEAVFTSTIETRFLIRELLDEGKVRQARRSENRAAHRVLKTG